MRGLVLVDVDNVLTEGGRLPEFEEEAADFLAKCRGNLTLDSCVVSLVFNTTSVSRYELTFEAVRTAGQTLGAALGSPTVSVETGITLTMPQTADVLLERLARESPTAEGAGPYSFLAAFTDDGGLKSSLRAYLDKCAGKSPWMEIGPRYGAVAWRCAEAGQRATRKPPPPADVSAVEKAPVELVDYTVCVSSGHAMAAWAGTQEIGIPVELDLRGLANLIDREPWLLSQIGATDTTVRGLARMAPLPREKSRLGAVSKKDGVELRGKGKRPAELSGARTASVGIGAVRGAEGATVACRLPVDVLAQGERAYELDATGVRTRAALEHFSPGENLGTRKVIVRFAQRGSDLVAKVCTEPTKQPAAWWLRESKPESERRFRAGRRLHGSLEVDAISMRNPENRCGVRLALRSPVEAEAIVQVERRIASGEIGPGSWIDAKGKVKRLAILAASRPLEPGNASVHPIHRVRRSGALSDFVEDLWVLPLVVAQ